MTAAHAAGLTDRIDGKTTAISEWYPDSPLSAVVCSPSAFAGLTADERAPVREVLEQMRQCNRTTTLVMRGPELRGIFTERDVLHKVALRQGILDRAVGELMTPRPSVV